MIGVYFITLLFLFNVDFYIFNLAFKIGVSSRFFLKILFHNWSIKRRSLHFVTFDLSVAYKIDVFIGPIETIITFVGNIGQPAISFYNFLKRLITVLGRIFALDTDLHVVL